LAGRTGAPRLRAVRIRGVAFLSLLALATLPATASAATVNVTVSDFQFSPSTVTITERDTVVWRNTGSFPHNVRFNDGSYEQPPNPSSSSWRVQRTFNTAGSFSYICRQHPDSMQGVVNVSSLTQPPGTDGAPAAPTVRNLSLARRRGRGIRIAFTPSRASTATITVRRRRRGRYRLVRRLTRRVGTRRKRLTVRRDRRRRRLRPGRYRVAVQLKAGNARGPVERERLRLR
jgi:plastocyanin